MSPSGDGRNARAHAARCKRAEIRAAALDVHEGAQCVVRTGDPSLVPPITVSSRGRPFRRRRKLRRQFRARRQRAQSSCRTRRRRAARAEAIRSRSCSADIRRPRRAPTDRRSDRLPMVQPAVSALLRVVATVHVLSTAPMRSGAFRERIPGARRAPYDVLRVGLVHLAAVRLDVDRRPLFLVAEREHRCSSSGK